MEGCVCMILDMLLCMYKSKRGSMNEYIFIQMCMSTYICLCSWVCPFKYYTYLSLDVVNTYKSGVSLWCNG